MPWKECHVEDGVSGRRPPNNASARRSSRVTFHPRDICFLRYAASATDSLD